MDECICSSCKNLKLVIDEDGNPGEYECSFGYPSDECALCDNDMENCSCSITCGNYVCDKEEDQPVILHCSGCGRELSQLCSEDREGEVFCFDCYLKESQG